MLELIASTYHRRCDDDVDLEDNDGDAIIPNWSSIDASIADVGCDHGILSLCLACMSMHASNATSGRRPHSVPFYSSVLGTDLSSVALGNGAMVSWRRIVDAMTDERRLRRRDGSDDGDVNGSSEGWDDDTSMTSSLPVGFRVGRGLDPLDPGEADAIVISGMGAQTMLEILFGNATTTMNATNTTTEGTIDECDSPVPADRVMTHRVYLQPTNSRPQHMMLLYERMQRSRVWSLVGETISYSGGRWYINSCFERRRRRRRRKNDDADGDEDDDAFCYPGQFLVRGETHKRDDGAYDAYVKHHLRWLGGDYERPRYRLEGEDGRWLRYIQNAKENDRWRDLASWFRG